MDPFNPNILIQARDQRLKDYPPRTAAPFLGDKPKTGEVAVALAAVTELGSRERMAALVQEIWEKTAKNEPLNQLAVEAFGWDEAEQLAETRRTLLITVAADPIFTASEVLSIAAALAAPSVVN